MKSIKQQPFSKMKNMYFNYNFFKIIKIIKYYSKGETKEIRYHHDDRFGNLSKNAPFVK